MVMQGSRWRTKPSESYADILSLDVRTPDFLFEGELPELDLEGVDASRYYDAAFFAKEARHLWPHVWQMVCREEDIAAIGDYQIYEILDKSLIIARSAPDRIKAFYNSCLHRGRKLVTHDGCKREFKCPFHGLTWSAEGTFVDNPMAWDFPQWDGRDMSLPEVRVETWSGYVFVNFDPDAAPLLDTLGPIVEHFERWDYADRYKAVHVCKVIRANWKVTAEAFMEAHHTLTTHPQLMVGLADANSQYDIQGEHVMRLFSATGVSSPFLASPPTEDEIFAYFRANPRRVRLAENAKLPEGTKARRYMADLLRQSLSETTGKSYEEASDAEIVDGLLYHVFPNATFWGGYSGSLCYRWRPNGIDPESSLMDVMLIMPVPKDGPRPKPAKVRRLGVDEPWTDAPELGGLGGVFDQDVGNLAHIQTGLKASGTGKVHFTAYTEMGIRYHNELIDRIIAEHEQVALK
jgi:phenylpropionate dioxygenase-like ring-hydroxylating dioxygenase large terminal subunit